jgi:hypothetical protein
VDESAVALTGFDDACIGVYHDHLCDCHRIVYSTEKIIDILMLSGLSYEEAVEHYTYNIEGSCMAESAPILVSTEI